jgi:hypothetical protein
MSKPKLNTERVKTELSESAFFRPQTPEPQEDAAAAEQMDAQETGPSVLNGRTPEQAFNRTSGRVNERAVIRASFDIFQDQQHALAEIQTARFKKTGKKPKMGELAQEAFDLYIKVMTEQANG